MSPTVAKAMYRFWKRCCELRPGFSLPKPEKQRLARVVRQEYGIEMTPDEAEKHLNDAMRAIQLKMITAGHSEFADMTLEEVREAVRDAYR